MTAVASEGCDGFGRDCVEGKWKRLLGKGLREEGWTFQPQPQSVSPALGGSWCGGIMIERGFLIGRRGFKPTQLKSRILSLCWMMEEEKN